MVIFEVYVDDVKVLDIPLGSGDPFTEARNYVAANYPNKESVNGFEIKRVVVPD